MKTIEISNCCGAKVKVAGDVTKYYVCSKCGKPPEIIYKGTLETVLREMLKNEKLCYCGCHNTQDEACDLCYSESEHLPRHPDLVDKLVELIKSV